MLNTLIILIKCIHYKKSWFFHWFILTKVLTLTRRNVHFDYRHGAWKTCGFFTSYFDHKLGAWNTCDFFYWQFWLRRLFWQDTNLDIQKNGSPIKKWQSRWMLPSQKSPIELPLRCKRLCVLYLSTFMWCLNKSMKHINIYQNPHEVNYKSKAKVNFGAPKMLAPSFFY